MHRDYPELSTDEILGEVTPTIDNVSEWSDRALLEYLALNTITTENLVKAIEQHIPGMLASLKDKLENDPTLRTILKFLPGVK